MIFLYDFQWCCKIKLSNYTFDLPFTTIVTIDGSHVATKFAEEIRKFPEDGLQAASPAWRVYGMAYVHDWALVYKQI